MNIMINENLKALRKKKNKRQEDLAEFLSVSINAISKWERGECYPDIELLPKLAEYYNLSVDDLLLSEIKTIERTMSLRQISESTSAVAESSNKIAASIEEVAAAINSIDALVAENKTMSQEIQEITKDLGVSLHQINIAIRQIERAAYSNAATAEDLAVAIAQDLKELTGE